MTEEIPFPGVPTEVSEKTTVDEEIAEMKEWFKAWRDQDKSTRDYTEHFKPVMCYLEGGWTKTDQDVDEPFESDRHSIDAKTWKGLQEKEMFFAYTGSKNIDENLSFLPRKIMRIDGTTPVIGQWNYRILCHPVSFDIPLNRLRVVDDLSSRMRYTKSLYRHKFSRLARFQLNSKDEDEPIKEAGLLDKIMAEIPGKNNYNSKSLFIFFSFS